MAKNSVEYDIKVDINQIKSSLNQVEANMRNVGSTVTSQTSMMQKGFSGLGTAMAGFFAVDTLINFGQKIITARSEFEKFRSVLTTSYGSVTLANKAMEMLRQTAEETPYQLNEITGAFVLLKNRGLEPSKKDLINVGDVASATGKTFEQLSQAILDANNSERWREFGIEVKTMGDKMALSFKGTTIEVERSAEGAMKAVTAFGQMDGIAGSMSGQMDTLGGKVSNLGDAFNNLLISIGDSELWNRGIENWTHFITRVNDLISSKGTDTSYLAFKLLEDVNGLPVEEMTAALKEKLTEYNNKAKVLEDEMMSKRGGWFSGKKKWVKENEPIYNTYVDAINIINDKLKELGAPKGGTDDIPALGILDELRKKLKELNDELGAQPTEKMLLQKQTEIEAVKEKIKYYEDLYEAKKKAAFWAGKDPGPLGEHTNYSPGGAKQDKITGFAAQNVAAAKAAQEAVDKIRQDNVSSYKKMTDSLELLDKTYHDAGTLKDKAYYKEKNKIVGDFLQEAMGNVNQLADIVGQFDEQAGQMISKLGSSMVGLFSANPITQLLSGIQLVMQLGQAFGNALGNQVNFEAEMEAINKTLEETGKLLSDLSSNNSFSYYKDYADAQKVIDNSILEREKKLAEHEKGLKKEQGRAYQNPFINSDKRIKDYEKQIKADKEALEQLRKDKIQAEKDFNETITQTTTVSLSDAIVEGFKRGESEAEIFANNFKSLMMNAVGEALKRKTFDELSKQGGFYDVFTNAMSDGQLSPEETKELDKLYQDAIAYGKVLWEGANKWAENYPDATTDSSSSSMQGTIKGITEDTGNKLEGSFNAVRISLIEQKAIAMQGYNQLVMIENNTRPISEIRDILKGGSTTQINQRRANGR
jgi:hypothetical protein